MEFECKECEGNLGDLDFVLSTQGFSTDADDNLVAELECEGCNTTIRVVFEFKK